MNFKPLLLAASLLGTLPVAAQQPSAEAIMRGARMSASLTKLDHGLTGTMKQGRTKVPLTLFLMGKDIQFQFTVDKQQKIFHLRIRDNSFDLFEVVNGKAQKFPPTKLTTPIAGTDVTYEDLSMRFLYWPNPKLEGTEKVGGMDCYKIRIDKPRGKPGAYEVVYVWVHTKHGAFMRVRGHDTSGNLIKEFQVEDVMKIDNDVWTLRKMQIATHDPKTGRRKSITDLSMDTNRKSVGPRGLR